MKKVFFIAMTLLATLAPNVLVGAKKSANKKYEKIYAVMITGKDEFHKFLAERSVQAFLAQTYPNKHLIIVNDGNYSLGDINKELITEIKLDKKYVLGMLRNISWNQIPEGGLYFQWDDDDWHHPDLMKKQYEYMKKNSADACILLSQVMYCFRINAAWVSSRKSGIEGTVICRKKGDILYPEMARSEDSVFLNEYKKKYKLVKWDNPAHYYLRFVHGHNTWDDNHFKLDRFKENEWLISKDAIAYLAKIVPLYTSSK
jgi:glycosyltransferase involved in cell wall biosynthesis